MRRLVSNDNSKNAVIKGLWCKTMNDCDSISYDVLLCEPFVIKVL